jgi:hypothetical protein
MKKRKASFGSYWLLDPANRDVADKLTFPLLDRVGGAIVTEAFHDRHVLFDGALSVAVIYFPTCQEEPNQAQVGVLHEKWARTSGEGLFLSVETEDGYVMCLRQRPDNTLEIL